jgi:hypothetical protein
MSSRTGQVRRNRQGASRRVRRAANNDLTESYNAVEATFDRIFQLEKTVLLVRRMP